MKDSKSDILDFLDAKFAKYDKKDKKKKHKDKSASKSLAVEPVKSSLIQCLQKARLEPPAKISQESLYKELVT